VADKSIQTTWRRTFRLGHQAKDLSEEFAGEKNQDERPSKGKPEKGQTSKRAEQKFKFPLEKERTGHMRKPLHAPYRKKWNPPPPRGWTQKRTNGGREPCFRGTWVLRGLKKQKIQKKINGGLPWRKKREN